MNPITVSELNAYVKAYFDANPVLSNLFVRGEISNFKRHSSGHCYLSLKDDGAVVKAVMFKYSAMGLEFEPENGMKVIVSARLSSYERDGVYQLYINEMHPDGVGDLHIRFEQLKKKLEGEGIFDSANKKEIPRFPKKIGIVTSPTGAALRDMENIITRRFPMTEILVYPALVQGEGAHKTIVKGIEYFNKNKVDTIIIGRGGGSVEDLWCFNEEELARAIFASEIPIISAVGHETDYTISDLAADLRAPTPSAAAELAVPSSDEIRSFLYSAKGRLSSGIVGNLNRTRQKLDSLKESRIFKNPLSMIENKNLEVAALTDKIHSRYEKVFTVKKESFKNLTAKLDALSPLKILKRGYAFVENEKDEVTDSIEKLSVGADIKLNFSDGKAICEVKELKGE